MGSTAFFNCRLQWGRHANRTGAEIPMYQTINSRWVLAEAVVCFHMIRQLITLPSLAPMTAC